MKRALLVVAALTLPGATLPYRGPLDPHIQRVMYDPDQVVSLHGSLGWQLMIEFAPDERIENVSIGDSLAWQVTPNKRAKMLFLKPLTRRGSTNMTVVTSQRRYAFSLATEPRSARIPWVLRFDYPPPEVVLLPAPPPLTPVRLNFGYARAGDPSILPSRVWDDGRQTYFEFPELTPIPAIFAAGSGKKPDEALVNVATRGRIQVVQQIGARFILRSGNHLATITRTP